MVYRLRLTEHPRPDRRCHRGREGVGRPGRWSPRWCPGIRAGLVAVTGLDPKGGMELFPGRALFTHYADESPVAMVEAAWRPQPPG